MTIWGNHSNTQYPDFTNAKSREAGAGGDHRPRWLENTFIDMIQTPGAAIIAARGKSSAASAASAVLDHVRAMINKTEGDNWYSMGVVSDGNKYGIADNLIFSFPITSDGKGNWEIIDGVPISDFAQKKLDTTQFELIGERNQRSVRHQLFPSSPCHRK